MPEKDFTDYIIEILDGGDRVYHWQHIRQLKKDEPIDHIMHNGYMVIIDKDKAFLTQKYRRYVRKRFLNPIKLVYALFRSKKLGLIKYKEPPGGYQVQYEDVEVDVPASYDCKLCEFSTEHEPAMKAHITRKHKGAKFDKIAIPLGTKKATVKREKIQTLEPYHLSKIHQPTGLMIDSPELKALPAESVLRTYTPILLKKEIENELYKKAVQSPRYGELKKVTQNWWIWVIFGVVIIAVFFMLSGGVT